MVSLWHYKSQNKADARALENVAAVDQVRLEGYKKDVTLLTVCFIIGRVYRDMRKRQDAVTVKRLRADTSSRLGF